MEIKLLSEKSLPFILSRYEGFGPAICGGCHELWNVVITVDVEVCLIGDVGSNNKVKTSYLDYANIEEHWELMILEY